MKLRWMLWLVLLLSVGVNLGVLLTMRRQAKPEPEPVAQVEPIPRAPAQIAPATSVSPEVSPAEPAPAPAAPAPRAPRTPRTTPSTPQQAPAPAPAPVSPPDPFPDDPRPAASTQAQPIPGPRFDRVADELRLRPEQRGPFIEVQRRHFDVVRQRREELNAARRLLSREFLSGAAEQERVRTQLAEVQRLQRGLDDQLAQLLLDAQAVLDEPQQRRFAELVLERIRNGPPQRPGMGVRRGGPLRRGVPPR